MIQRLLDQSYFARQGESEARQLDFWLRELRTPELLLQLAQAYPERALQTTRPAVAAARGGDAAEVARALEQEEQEERLADRLYWEPLKRELEQLRQAARRC